MKNISWKKILFQTLWLIIGISTVVLFGAALKKKDNKLCKDVRVEFVGSERDQFIDEKEVLDLLNNTGFIVWQKVTVINLTSLENALKKNLWVKNAEIYFDNNEVLHVKIEERQPLVRVFTLQGNSFYVDSEALRLPLSSKLSVKVPMVTGFPSDNRILSHPDSITLLNVVKFGKYIRADSFWMAQVSQIVITPQATFEMIPSLGNQIIEFGGADNLDNKFNRLYSFYKQAWLQNGIDKYERLCVQFDNQVVAVKHKKSNIGSDSLNQIPEIVLNRTVSSEKNVLGNIKSNYTTNDVLAKKDSVYKHKLVLNSVRKNVIMLKQNKVTNKPLSFKHKGTKSGWQRIQSDNLNQPKALMSKE